MKRLFALLLCAAVLFVFAGCGRAEDTVEHKIDSIEETLEQKVNDAVNALTPPKDTAGFTPIDPAQLISPEEAQRIALEHAGVSAEDATGLHAVIDIDNGRQEYDVEFRVGHLEYEYEIDASTGAVLSFDKDS